MAHWPKFSVPYKIVDEQITYNDVLINLDCMPCYDHCSTCPSDMFYNKVSINTNDYKDQDKCFYESCPSGKVSKLTNGVNLCVNPIEFDIIGINFTTLTCATSVQPINKPLIINVTTTIDQNTTSN